MFVYLFLIVIIFFAVDCFKLAAVYTDGCFTQQPCIPKKLNIQPKHILKRLCMQFTEIGNGMIIWLQALQQPLQFDIAAAFFFQFAAAADFIEVAVEV